MYSKVEELIEKFKIEYEKQYLFLDGIYIIVASIYCHYIGKKELRKGIFF